MLDISYREQVGVRPVFTIGCQPRGKWHVDRYAHSQAQEGGSRLSGGAADSVRSTTSVFSPYSVRIALASSFFAGPGFALPRLREPPTPSSVGLIGRPSSSTCSSARAVIRCDNFIKFLRSSS